MNDVLMLITKMSKNEKRYFKTFHQKNSSDKKSKTLLLFDEYNALSTDYVDLSGFRETFTNINYLNHILYKQLLESLNAYQKENSLSFKLISIYQNSITLYNKGLFRQSLRQINKGSKLSNEIEDFVMELQFLELSKKVTKELFDKNVFVDEIHLIANRESKLLSKLEQLVSFKEKELVTTFIARTVGFQHSESADYMFYEIRLFLKHNTIEDCLTVRTKRMFLYMKALIFLHDNNYENALEAQLEILKLYQNKQIDKRVNTIDYFGDLYNACSSHVYLRQFIKAKELYKELDVNLKRSSLDLITLKRFNYIGMEIAIYNCLGEYNQSVLFNSKVVQGIKKFGSAVHFTAKIYMSFQLAYAFYGNNDYQQSKYQLNKIVYDENIDSFPRIKIQSQLLLLILLYEKALFQQVQNNAQNIFQLEMKNIVKYPRLNMMLIFFSKNHELDGKQNLEKLYKQFSNVKTEAISTDFHFDVWVRSLINKTNYREEMKHL